MITSMEVAAAAAAAAADGGESGVVEGGGSSDGSGKTHKMRSLLVCHTIQNSCVGGFRHKNLLSETLFKTVFFQTGI